jgi:type II restriction enzyme
MSAAIAADKTPNLFALHYEAEDWIVRNLILVPRFSYSLSVIKKRNPLSATAERNDWVGCTILLGEISQEAKIPIVSDGVAAPVVDVRRRYRKLKKLGRLSVVARGWTLDVLCVIHMLGKPNSLCRTFMLSKKTSSDYTRQIHPT